jgi:hypothetical protein
MLREREGAVHDLVWRPEVNRLLGKHRRRCEDVNKVDLQDIVWERLDGLIWLGGLTHGGHLCMC